MIVSNGGSQEGSAESTHKRAKRWTLGVATAVLIAFLTAIVSGLGSEAFDHLTASDAPLLSFGAEEQGYECGSMTYLPQRKTGSTLRRPPPTDWPAFQHQSEAAFAGGDVVQVSVQGESARAVTLTGIRFSVKRHKRSGGALFSAPCGGPLTGRGLSVDVESDPPRIAGSSRTKGGYIGATSASAPHTVPIAFPWTVSLSEPLLLYVVATAKVCYCIWAAEIPWVSGGKRGTIRLDNEGRGYRVVGGEELPGYAAGGKEWTQYQF